MNEDHIDFSGAVVFGQIDCLTNGTARINFVINENNIPAGNLSNNGQRFTMFFIIQPAFFDERQRDVQGLGVCPRLAKPRSAVSITGRFIFGSMSIRKGLMM